MNAQFVVTNGRRIQVDKKISRIEVDLETNDVTFFFENDTEPFSAAEFKPLSLMRKHLGNIEYEIQDYNTEVEILRHD